MKKIKVFLKKLNKIQMIFYVLLFVADIYILGSVDFISNKLYGFLFVVINACLISFIKYGKSSK